MRSFRQVSSIGRKDIAFDGNTVFIKNLGRNKAELSFRLDQLQPQVRITKVRCQAFIVIPLCIGVLALLGLRIGLMLGSTSGVVLALFSLIVVCLSVRGAFNGLFPFVVVQFFNEEGVLVFDIVRGREQAKALDEFMEALCAEIKIARGKSEPLDSGS